MRLRKTYESALLVGLLVFVAVAVVSLRDASAHCDRVNGPVAKDAREALETGDFEVIARWVGEEQEKELRKRFNECRSVRTKGEGAKDLAERYFMETAVRLHRAAEGFPFTGLKPASELPEDIERAEEALETGNAGPVVGLLASEMEKKVTTYLRRARQARREKDESLQDGREWVDAYVRYVIYVHGLYQKIQAGPAHGVGE